MVKLIRTINSRGRLLFFIFSLLLICCSSSASRHQHWPNLSEEELTFWSEMSQNFSIDCDKNNPHIQKQIRWYQQHPKHLQNILKKSEPFIHYVYEQTHQHNLPAELALLPLIESQYNPYIRAPSGAAGLWQMMPGTATKFGLKVNRSYDGRRDVAASTKAALTYLNYLNNYFDHNWLLAIAAYQVGEGRVAALTKTHSSNYWTLPLSKEYVPKLLAIAFIIKNPALYHISLPMIRDRTHQPQQTQPSPQEESREDEIQLPEITLTQKELSPPKTHKKPKTYTIKEHDTLEKIAKKFHVKSSQLQKTNHLKNAKRLKIGQSLIIPSSKK